MLSKAKKGSHIRTRDNMGFEMKRLRFKCPPKNWEARSWSGDGRRPSGALHSTSSAARSSLLFLFFFLKVCVASLALVEHWLARTVHRGSIYSGEAPGKAWIVFKSRILELGSSRPTRPSARSS
ncbi:unnamed protein product [Microthlaspi erraticum]|uniref:Uncharacterized protein n=1 Tax=Microthlaspi erraticum TaxID=1685480 RepID=A0A6D2KX76_9BRAS|nr:unnamed protein product [Microthlaspi erraticum]